MTAPVDVVRVNTSTWSWTSCIFSIDGIPTEGIVAIDYEEKLEARIISSNLQDGPPLGMSAGRYEVVRFPVRLLKDSARQLKTYLSAQAAVQGLSSFGQVTFTLGLQLSGLDAPDLRPSTTIFSGCRIIGERAAHEEGVEAAVTEFIVACLVIAQDGTALANAVPPLVGGLPAADAITVAGAPAPGKWTLIRAPKIYGWDIRQGYGLSGATVVPKGDELVAPRFLVELWTGLDYQLFQAFRSAFLKKALVGVAGSPVAMALGIDHPELKALGCTSVVVREVNPLLNDGWGVYQCEVEFLQYRPPAPALSKPNAAIPDTTPPAPTAQTQTEIELQKAQAELQALAP